MLRFTNSGLGGLRASGLLLAAVLTYAYPIWSQVPQNPKGPAPEGAATIATMAGRVDVMRDSTRWALSIGDWVTPGQMIVTGPDGWANFTLADGSTFEVFPNSQVSFRANRGDWRDLVEVLLGNIKVHIQKLGGQPNPNKVRTPTALISVRGTIFDVKVEDDGDTTIVMVEEGLVDVQHILLPGKVSVAAGEAVHVYKTVPLAQNKVDKGSAAQAIARGIAQGVYEILLRRQGSTGGSSIPTSTGGGVGGAVGDERAPTPPPAAPPPPPPPAPAP